MSMNFKTLFTRVSVKAESGSNLKPVYNLRYDKFGKRYLETTSMKNTDDFIQSHLDGCEVHRIIDRYSMLGDSSLLNKKSGTYGDFTGMPTTLAEVYTRVSEATEFFNSLPVELKREFNHSPSEFFSSIGSPKYNSVIESLNKSESNNEEVSINE